MQCLGQPFLTSLVLTVVQGDVDATVHSVQKTRQYVLHSVQLHSGTVCVGDNVTLLVDKVSSSSFATTTTITIVITIVVDGVVVA